MQSNFNSPHNKVFIRSGNIYNVPGVNSALIYWFLGIFAAEYVCGISPGWVHGWCGHDRGIPEI